LPTTPIQGLEDGAGEIALCILSAINVGTLRNYDDLENLCDLAVRALDQIIDYQNYPVKAAELSTKARRSLGIGYIGLAHYLAKRELHYSDDKAAQEVGRLTEAFQYYLISSSVELAKEKGACSAYNETKYSRGVLPIDTYKTDIDEFLGTKLELDWEELRAKVKEHGMRHSTLSAQMPSESSSVVSNETNGIEPPRAFMNTKKSKKGPLKQIVPQYNKLKNNYSFLWDEGVNQGYIKIVAAMQKFFDQAISGNWSYNPKLYENNEVPMSVMFNDLLTTYKYGWKTSYYQNTYDSKGEDEELLGEVPEEFTQLAENPSIVIEEEECEACNI
jgi:ribonucleoside-diphosphate reductase alpha chain